MPQPHNPVAVPAEYPASLCHNGTLHRVFDFVCATCGLCLLSPLFLLIAVAIKLDDGGPIFYRQARVGRYFRGFRIWKFRTMVPGADRLGLLTAPDDGRVTRIGQWLRRHKFDELPQLLNVWIGDMQLVGARPEVAHFTEMFRSEYADILQERPGITDPATLAYSHEEQIFKGVAIEKQYVEQILPAKLRLSMDYRARRTFWSDVQVILQTIFGIAR